MVENLETLISSLKIKGIDLYKGKYLWDIYFNYASLLKSLPSRYLSRNYNFRLDHYKIVKSQQSNVLFNIFIIFSIYDRDTFVVSVISHWQVDLQSIRSLHNNKTILDIIHPIGISIENYHIKELKLSKSDSFFFIVQDLKYSNTLVLLPMPIIDKSSKSNFYFSLFDEQNGEFESFLLPTLANCANSNSSYLNYSSLIKSGSLSELQYCTISSLASSIFVNNEMNALNFLSNVQYSSNNLDIVSGFKRAEVLGDDSILLKYINPGIKLIISKSFAPNNSSNYEAIVVITLIDAVSAKIIARINIEDAADPIHSNIIENNILISYWNLKFKRNEILSVNLFEGMIDKNGLGMFPIIFMTYIL